MQVTQTIPVTLDLSTAEQVAALQAEAREVGAAMRRIVDYGLDTLGHGVRSELADDLEKADAWLRAVGA